MHIEVRRRGVVIHKLYGPRPKKIDAARVDDLTQAALERAVAARTPP